ncbi:Lipoprotein signal peptidase [compost metagenome]
MSQQRTAFQTLCFYLVALSTFLLDQFTKLAIVTALALGHSTPVLDGFLHLTYVQNFGAAYSLLSGRVGLLAVIAATICLGIIVYQRIARPTHMAMVLALGFFLGGAMGNLTDRLVLGYVRDMVDIRWYGENIFPIFNVADVVLWLGIGCFFLHSYLAPKKPAQSEAA